MPTPPGSTDDHVPTDDTTPRPGTPGIRWELVNKMKAMIATGQLDTPERWWMAECFLLDQLTERGE
jgi:hypothetical protein